MGERLTITPEGEKNKAELDAVNNEKSRDLEKSRDAAAEKAGEQNAEKAREDVERAVEKQEKKSEKPSKSVAEKRRDTPLRTRKQREKQTFAMNMKEAQSQMKAPSRTFSKVIHNPVVEKTSEVAGATVARPNAIVAGSLSAFIVTLALYVVAKNLGYPLSGFESIAAFILGWAVGLLFDYLRVMITGKKA